MMAVVLSFYSCRNEDISSQEANSQRDAASFFQHAKTSNLYSKSGIDYITILEEYNREIDFLSTMPDQKGIPIWDKMQVLNAAEKIVLYVPLSSDDTSLSSLLLITLDENNKVSVLRNFTTEYLDKFVYNPEYAADKRKLLMDTFLHMDFLCFGRQLYTNLPTDLYDGYGEYNQLDIMEVNMESVNNGKFLYNFTCATLHVCANNCSLSTCDYNNCQHGGKCKVWKSCANTTNWVDDPISSYPSNPSCGSGCGGGGSSPSPNNPPKPKDPCALNTTFYRVITNCQGGNGNGNDFVSDPCEKTRALLEDPAVTEKVETLKEQSKIKEGQSNYGEKAFEINNAGTSSGIINGEEHQVKVGSTAGKQGVYHNHTPDGIKMLSPPDIIKMLHYALAQPNGNISNGFLGMVGSEECSSCPGGYKYHNYIIRFSGTLQELGGFTSQNWDKEDLIKTYRDAKYELSTNINYANYQYGPLNSDGLEKLFFDTLQNMGIEGKVNLQRIEDNGTILNITQNSNGITSATPCP